MPNSQAEARKKFAERAELRRAEHADGPRSFRQFAAGVARPVAGVTPGDVSEDYRADILEKLSEARLLRKFGIKENEAKKTLTGYREASSEKPLKNISRKAPFGLAKVALKVLSRRGIGDGKGLPLIVRAEDNAKSPQHFWELIEKYSVTLKERQGRDIVPTQDQEQLSRPEELFAEMDAKAARPRKGNHKRHSRIRDIRGSQPMKKPKKVEVKS